MRDPRAEYKARLAEWSQRADLKERAHLRMGNLRLLFAAGLVILTFLLAQTRIGVAIALVLLMFGLFLTGMLHSRILSARDRARRAVGFYEAGLARLAGSWAGKDGNLTGAEFLDPHHPYASDLDLFGPGSLFEFVNTAQTQSGRAMLAAWFCAPAPAPEIQARQEAVQELRLKMDLRERLGLIAAEAQGWIRTDSLMSWANHPPVLRSDMGRLAAFCFPLLNLTLFLAGQPVLCLALLAGQSLFAWYYHARVHQVVHDAAFAPGDLEWLASVLGCIESETFTSERLRRMGTESRSDGQNASEAIAQLGKLYSWLTSGDNFVFIIVCKFLLWETQFAFALEAWRARFGPKVEVWLRELAEIEALSSLSRHAYEHPEDPFPELLPPTDSARIEAQGLAHPLIAESRSVRNDLELGARCRLVMISGSNMSGKSTWLRAIGVNLVLASAGAPVRARSFRMTPVRLGASIRTMDSLQEGISRFYAEIKRLGLIVQLAAEGTPLVFLLDEVLSGTNSHDRRIGASCVALSLVQRGALGLMTTHDLALTAIVDEIEPPGQNFHFEDQIREGRISFDYQLRPGVVQKSNALELMRSGGLAV